MSRAWGVEGRNGESGDGVRGRSGGDAERSMNGTGRPKSLIRLPGSNRSRTEGRTNRQGTDQGIERSGAGGEEEAGKSGT